MKKKPRMNPWKNTRKQARMKPNTNVIKKAEKNRNERKKNAVVN